MASPGPSTSRQSSSNVHNLLIKAANQKYEDFLIEDVNLEWNIKRLKEHLHENYPKRPVRLLRTIRVCRNYLEFCDDCLIDNKITFYCHQSSYT